ncbi:hypothetical protein ABZ471_45985 [Streptomyces sp. NPDC005728]
MGPVAVLHTLGTRSFDLCIHGTVKEGDRSIHFDHDAVNFKT